MQVEGGGRKWEITARRGKAMASAMQIAECHLGTSTSLPSPQLHFRLCNTFPPSKLILPCNVWASFQPKFVLLCPFSQAKCFNQNNSVLKTLFVPWKGWPDISKWGSSARRQSEPGQVVQLCIQAGLRTGNLTRTAGLPKALPHLTLLNWAGEADCKVWWY